MKKSVVSLFVLMCAVVSFAAAEGEENLARMASPDFDNFYLASQFKASTAKKIYVESVPVAFSEDWMRDFRTKTSSHYQERIKEKYGDTLRELLVEGLQESGWQVFKEKTPGAYVLSPKIVGLNIYAPNEPGIRDVIIRNAGHATVNLDFKTPDGVTFIKIDDRRETDATVGSPIVANRATNYRYFKMLMELWSDKSIEYFNEVIDLVHEQGKAAK